MTKTALVIVFFAFIFSPVAWADAEKEAQIAAIKNGLNDPASVFQKHLKCSADDMAIKMNEGFTSYTCANKAKNSSQPVVFIVAQEVCTGTLNDGKLSGTTECKSPGGLTATLSFRNGLANGDVLVKTPNVDMKCRYRDGQAFGPCSMAYSDGKSVKMYIRDGIVEGKIEFFEQEKKIVEMFVKNGLFQGKIEMFSRETGKDVGFIFYKDGVPKWGEHFQSGVRVQSKMPEMEKTTASFAAGYEEIRKGIARMPSFKDPFVHGVTPASAVASAPASSGGRAPASVSGQAWDKPEAKSESPKEIMASMDFLGVPLRLAHKEMAPDNKGGLVEYIPAGETLQSWTKMFAARHIPQGEFNSQKMATLVHERNLKRKAAGDPMANSVMMRNEAIKATVVDFVVSEGDVVEHNIFYYKDNPDGSISMNQYAQRMYMRKGMPKSDFDAFFGGISRQRQAIVLELGRVDLPSAKK